VVGKEAIDEEGVDGDDHHGEAKGEREGLLDRHMFVFGVWILDGNVSQGEVLVVRFDRVKDVESNDEGTVAVPGQPRCQTGDARSRMSQRARRATNMMIK